MDPKYLFDDEKMREFIVNGFVTLKVDLPALHESIYRRTEEVFAKEGNPGNNILPRVPDLQQVFDHPAVRGGLTSLLGPSYIMHAHRHCHINPPGSKGQNWHKDSYWGYKKVRYHRSRWVMTFYYPQDVTEKNGPTMVIPGTQYYMTKPQNEEELARPILGEAGTVTFVHFDLWHRASPNLSDRNRYMMKFQFTRMEEPQQPVWNAREAAWRPLSGTSDDRGRIVWSQIWDWACGQKTNSSVSSGNGVAAVQDLLNALNDADEPVRLNAAYTLGAVGEPAVSALVQALNHENDPVRLSAAYALGGVGGPAVPALVQALNHENEHVRGHAAYALGDVGKPAQDAVSALTEALNDPSAWVRHHAAEALGTIAQAPEVAAPALSRALRDPDEQVRFNAAYALARFGHAANAAVPALREALNDENRYVRGHSAAALKRIGTPEAIEVLLDFLTTSRWCPLTTKETTY